MKSKTVENIQEALNDLSDKDKVKKLQKYFKTQPGEYGEGDQFIGVKVPDQRKVAKEFYTKTSFTDLAELLSQPIHEVRFTATFILVLQYEKSKDWTEKKAIVDFYLLHTASFNNWDLVDSSCYKILGHYAFHQNQEEILYRLADSASLWEKRMAVVSTLYFIKQKEFSIVTQIVHKNLHHPHDLMHKANGWMLREMGNIDEVSLLTFLDAFAQELPRTTLRYAIEKLPENIRKEYLKKK